MQIIAEKAQKPKTPQNIVSGGVLAPWNLRM
jgi:hypothetical protein